MRLVDIYRTETQQTRQAKTPDLRETIILSNAAEECRLRKIYVPMTAEEYDPETDSLNTISDPSCGGTGTNRFVTLQGTRYLERSYSENNIVGAVKTFWIMKAQGMNVTDMVRNMQYQWHEDSVTVGFIWEKPDWFDLGKDKIEMYSTRSATPANLSKSEWEYDETDRITNVEVTTVDGVQKIHITLRNASNTCYYGLWLYHSTGGTNLQSAVITETGKTATVQSSVRFYPMQPISGYDSSKDLLWVFNGGNKRFDFEIIPCTYEDGGTADFWVFDRSVSGTVELRLYQSTAVPPEDVREYTTAQVEEGLRNYVIVTTEELHYVCGGCIQTGGTSMIRTPNNKFFEMADGSCACYPSTTAKAETTLEFECTEAQAAAIENASRCGELVLAGLRCGAAMGESLLPPRTGYRAYPNGKFEIEKMFACANIYRVRMPVRFDVSGENYRSLTLPVICPVSVTIGENADSLDEYSYRLLGGNPVFVRNNTILTSAEYLTISVSFFQADSEETLTGCTAIVRNSKVPGTPVPLPCGSPFSIANGLVNGLQLLDIEISKTGLNPLRLRLQVYRQAVSE